VQRRRIVRYELVPAFDLGLHVNFAGLLTENVAMGGVQGAFRIRPLEHLAIDVGAGLFGGESWNYGPGSGGRWEIPFVVDLLLFFNPQHRFQVYALVGGGASYAVQEVGPIQREMAYLGGQVGLGFEWRLGRHFALHLDLRGFLRSHVSEGPEFTRTTARGTIQTTDLSGGFYGTVGMTFYIGG
jgi:hypothetical protein